MIYRRERACAGLLFLAGTREKLDARRALNPQINSKTRRAITPAAFIVIYRGRKVNRCAFYCWTAGLLRLYRWGGGEGSTHAHARAGSLTPRNIVPFPYRRSEGRCEFLANSRRFCHGDDFREGEENRANSDNDLTNSSGFDLQWIFAPSLWSLCFLGD